MVSSVPKVSLKTALKALHMATFEKRELKNGTSFKAFVRIKGYPTQRKTFKRLTDAKLWAQQVEATIRKGAFHTLIQSDGQKTFSDLAKRYRDEIWTTKSSGTVNSEKAHLAFWEDLLGEYGLAHITSAQISAGMKTLGQGKSAATGKLLSKRTLQYYRNTLSFVFKNAISWGLSAHNPVDGVAAITKLNNARVRYLNDAERDDLLAACKAHPNPQLYPIVVLALATGARQGEILNLQVHDVDLSTGKTILRDTKNGETRSIPLVAYALEIIKDQAEYAERLYFDLPKSNYKYLFPRPDGLKHVNIRHAWYQAVEAAGITDFKFHDLRHSAASYLAMNGATLLEIAAILGHKTLAMVKRYAHLSEDHTRAVVAKMNQKIF